MHTVEKLEAALARAKQLGYRVRFEWLEGVGGGCCEVKGQKWLFVDLSLSPGEQLEEVTESLAAQKPADAGRPPLRRAG